jgi:hypothetical protein
MMKSYLDVLKNYENMFRNCFYPETMIRVLFFVKFVCTPLNYMIALIINFYENCVYTKIK